MLKAEEPYALVVANRHSVLFRLDASGVNRISDSFQLKFSVSVSECLALGVQAGRNRRTPRTIACTACKEPHRRKSTFTGTFQRSDVSSASASQFG